MNRVIGQDLLTRVEGHGSLELIREEKTVVDARFHLHESPRLFEKLLIGRRYDEVADIACRICSICSTAHKIVSLQAMESALGVRITAQTEILRRLALLGGTIESHALHLICLALPDYRNVGYFASLADSSPLELAHGLKIKAFGNLLQETVGGRAIHPFNLLPGGIGKVPTIGQLQDLAEKTTVLDDHLNTLSELCENLLPILPPLPALAAAAVDHTGHALTTSRGETVEAEHIIDWLQQEQVPHSNALLSRFDGKRVYQVGPLARQIISGNMDKSAAVSASPQARGMELRQAFDEARAIIATLLSDGMRTEEPVFLSPKLGKGIALLEAPRGTLIHRYCFDDRGICTEATVITPTAINQGAIQDSLSTLIGVMQGCPESELRFAAEHLVRLFDPCISCAVH